MSISPEDAMDMVEKAIDRLAPSVGAPLRKALDDLTFADRADLAEELARLMERMVQAAYSGGDW